MSENPSTDDYVHPRQESPVNPENTTKRQPLEHLAGIMSEGQSGYITGMESAGQAQLVNSDRVPTDLNGLSEEDFTALGFTFGPADPDDPMFRPASLPPGWRREGSSHAMWSYITDERGIHRVSIFYKAAFYDRRAHMGIVNVGRSAVNDYVYGDTDDLPDTLDLLTADEREEAVSEARAYLAKAEKYGDIYADHVPRVESLLHALGEATP